MLGKGRPQRGFEDQALFGQVDDDHWLMRLDNDVDWNGIEQILDRLYGSTGKPSHWPLAVFKMLLLGQWHGLSDPQTEAQVRDRLSFRRFVGLGLMDQVPDETTLVRFRQRLVAHQADADLFDAVTAQLEGRGLLIKRGTLVDATIVQSSRKPPSKDERVPNTADPEAAWAVKNDKPVAHGYKTHVAVDQGSDLVRAVTVTPGNVHDSVELSKLTTGQHRAVYADKGYDYPVHRDNLKKRGIAARILRRDPRGGKLSPQLKAYNRRWSKTRAAVERLFADWKCRRTLRRARYLGLRNNLLHSRLLAIAHNLRRMPLIGASA